MWFKNLSVYRLTPNLNLDLPKLEESLTRQALQPCGKQDMESQAGYRRAATVGFHMF